MKVNNAKVFIPSIGKKKTNKMAERKKKAGEFFSVRFSQTTHKKLKFNYHLIKYNTKDLQWLAYNQSCIHLLNHIHGPYI